MRQIDVLPTLDAHAHLEASRTREELERAGAVLAMTSSLEEATIACGRRDPLIAWGVGCHPRRPEAQQAFDADRFRALVEQTAVVGEIGLDRGSRVPFHTQLAVFRKALEVLADHPRLVSIHSHRATAEVIEGLQRTRVAVPVLHWWTGTVHETREAVALGCYFSIHSAIARHSKFRNHVPRERILIESDHGYNDPPAGIPPRIEWVEHLVAQQFALEVSEIRHLVWQNLARIVGTTDTRDLLPGPLAAVLPALPSNS